MTVDGALGRGSGVPGAGQHDARIGQVRPRQLGGGRGLVGPAPRLLDGRLGDDAGAGAHTPPRSGEAVALGCHDHQVVAGEREVDRLLPAVDADGPADEGVEDRLGHGPTLARPDVGAYGLGAAARGQRVGRRRRGAARAGMARGQHGARHAPLAQRRQGGLGGSPAVDHHGGDPGARRGLERGVPPVVDLDQVDQRAHDPVDVAQQLAPPAPCRSASARSSASARAAVR